MFTSNIFGFPVVVSPHLPREHYADEIAVIPYSRHRSKRIWKKLRQRRRREAVPLTRPMAYRIGSTLFVPPEIWEALK